MDKKGNTQSSLPKHLLLVRLSAMGDVAMVVHAIRALRTNYPDLKISLLSKGLFEPLFEGLDVELIPIDVKGRHKGVFGILRLAREMAALGIDYVADLHSVLRTSLLRSFLNMYGIRSSRMLKGRVSKWMRMDGGCGEVTKPLKHTVLRYCDVIRQAGFIFEDPAPIPPQKREIPPQFIRSAGERWIGVAPFSAHEGKSYPLHLVTAVIEQLAAKYERVFIHSGGGFELDYAQQMASQYPNVSSVYGTLNLKEEIDLIANLDCIVTMDSFAMHIASIVGTPIVSVWGATHPSLGFSAFNPSYIAYVQLDLPCRPCSTFGKKKCRLRDYRCLYDIKPSSIVDQVQKVLESV